MAAVQSQLDSICQKFEDLGSNSETAWLFIACTKERSNSDVTYNVCASHPRVQQLVQRKGPSKTPVVVSAVRDACLAALSEPFKGKLKVQKLLADKPKPPSRAAASAIPVVSALSDLIAWAPFLVATALQGGTDTVVRVGLAVTFALTLVQLFVNYLLCRLGVLKVWPRLFEVCQSIIYGTLLVTSFVHPRSRIPLRWFFFVSTASLAAAALLSTSILHPMTIDYARERVPQWSWQLRSIKRGSYIVTFCWAGALCLVALSKMVTLLLRRPDASLAALFNYVLPYTLVAALISFTNSFLAPTWRAIHARDASTNEETLGGMEEENQVEGGPTFENLKEFQALVAWPMAAIVVAFASLVSACTSGFSLWTMLPYFILIAIGLWSRYTTAEIVTMAQEWTDKGRELVAELVAERAASTDLKADSSAAQAGALGHAGATGEHHGTTDKGNVGEGEGENVSVSEVPSEADSSSRMSVHPIDDGEAEEFEEIKQAELS